MTDGWLRGLASAIGRAEVGDGTLADALARASIGDVDGTLLDVAAQVAASDAFDEASRPPPGDSSLDVAVARLGPRATRHEVMCLAGEIEAVAARMSSDAVATARRATAEAMAGTGRPPGSPEGASWRSELGSARRALAWATRWRKEGEGGTREGA